MKKYVMMQVGMFALVLAIGGAAQAQTCRGDCNGDTAVAVNELIMAVNIALGTALLDTCDVVDENSSGTVEINELVSAVLSSLTQCGTTPRPTDTPTSTPTATATATRTPTNTATPAPNSCGDNVTNTAAGEECDDGNNLGGDGCAANCTNESRRTTNLNSALSVSVVQTGSFPVVINLVGVQVFITGKPRDTTVTDPEGNVITKPGEMPVAKKADGDVFAPVVVAGLVCACVRAIQDDVFGPGNSGSGVIGCGAAGLTDTDYKLAQDHNATPGSPGNGVAVAPMSQLPNDPECDDVFTFPSGVESLACLEGTGPGCSEPNSVDIGVCNSARDLQLSGGQSPRGAALINNSTAIGLLQDGGVCQERRFPNGACNFPDYGPDCKPCTADDVDFGNTENLPTTTGFASAAIYDATNQPGLSFDIGSQTACTDNSVCKPGENCTRTCEESGLPCPRGNECDSGETCLAARCEFLCGGSRCITSAQGSRFDCDALLANPTGGLSGAGLALAFPALDARTIGDNVTSTVLALE